MARKCEFDGNDESKPIFDGWVARRWDPAVIQRYKLLFDALAKELDGRIEGLNLPETSVGFGDSGRLHPDGYTFESYENGVKAIMGAAREAFPRSREIQYANFMPGEWLPWNDNGYLRGVYEHANESARASADRTCFPTGKDNRATATCSSPPVTRESWQASPCNGEISRKRILRRESR